MALQGDGNLAKVTAERGEETCSASRVLGRSACESHKWLSELLLCDLALKDSYLQYMGQHACFNECTAHRREAGGCVSLLKLGRMKKWEGFHLGLKKQ